MKNLFLEEETGINLEENAKKENRERERDYRKSLFNLYYHDCIENLK